MILQNKAIRGYPFMKKPSKSIIRMLGAFLMVCALVGCADYESTKDKEQNSKNISETTIASETTTITSFTEKTIDSKNTSTTKATDSSETSTEAPTEPKTEAPTEPPKPEETLSQKNAVRSAKSYIDLQGFSYDGLVKQLEFEKYFHEDAVYGADNCGADWFAEAAESAKSYMDLMPMSRDELIGQLEFEGFTSEQAEYGAQSVGY